MTKTPIPIPTPTQCSVDKEIESTKELIEGLLSLCDRYTTTLYILFTSYGEAKQKLDELEKRTRHVRPPESST